MNVAFIVMILLTCHFIFNIMVDRNTEMFGVEGALGYARVLILGFFSMIMAQWTTCGAGMDQGWLGAKQASYLL